MSRPNEISNFDYVYVMAAILFAAVSSTSALAAGANSDQQKYANERISIDHARVARSAGSSQPSLMSKAAEGRVLAEAPEAPLDGTLVRGKVRKVGYLESHGACGPVCDCASCGAEPVCGIEVGCGLEPGCGVDFGYGEVGCGIEPDCGYEIGCGIEAGCDYEVGCGLEMNGECGCDACCPEVDSIPLCLPLLRVNWGRFDFFAGVQGFKGPMNFANTGGNSRDGTGSFGFYEGFNEGRSLRRWCGWDMAAQFGVRATQSNLAGASFTSQQRNQVFVTGGLFRRVDYGLQYGAVIDYLNDDWYFQGDLLQVRSELSWRADGCHVWGFQYHAGLDDQTSDTSVRDGAGGTIVGTVDFEATTQYRFFYRRLLNQSGQWDSFAGWTDRDDGILGSHLNLPLRRNVVLSTGATYLIPKEGSSNRGYEEEGWNLAMGLIYRPGGPKGCGRYCRPMFDVADNGSFLVDRK
jgi:hypothetical protein